MIVANKMASTEKANEVSKKLLSIIIDELNKFQCEDDPAENIYYVLHIGGIFVAKIALVLKNYGIETHGIEKLNSEISIKLISDIANEHIKANMEMMK